MAHQVGVLGRVSLALLALIIGAFFTLSITIFEPYVSDRFELPFPSLFAEFELDSKTALKSGVQKTRGRSETCRRRVAPEYESYRLGSSGVLEYVPSKPFVVAGDMPPGWLSYTPLDKLVLLIVDGCRLDYALYDPTLKPGESRSVFTNHLPLFHEYMSNGTNKGRVRMFQFVAPVPTFTVYSIKCMYTGETRRGNMMGQTNNTTMLQLDNVGEQMISNDEKICSLGDVFSAEMFGAERLAINHTSIGADIYNMKVPDRYVYEYYKDVIDACGFSVLHILAIDHLGHAGKRVSSDMTYYLDDYDILLRKVIEHSHTHKDAMLMIVGDHGQKTNGSHGGGTKEEVDAFMFVKSDLELAEVVRDTCDLEDAPVGYAMDHNVLNGTVSLGYSLIKDSHTNLAATASLLMNKPIPYHSGGLLIKDVVPLIKDSNGAVDEELSLKYMAQLLHIVAHQTLRTVDTTVSADDKRKHRHIYSKIQRERVILSYYYSYVRSLGRMKLKLGEMRAVYGSYMRQCERLTLASNRLIEISNMSMTPEYMMTAVLMSVLSCILLPYLFLAACRIYHVNHLSESDAALFEGQKFASVGRIIFRAFWKLAVAGIASFACAKTVEYADEQLDLSRALPQRPVVGLCKEFMVRFESLCGLGEQTFWFHLAACTTVFFGVLFLLDIPFFVSGYWFLYREGAVLKDSDDSPLPLGDFDSHMAAVLSKLPKWEPVWFIAALYIGVVLTTIVSQCATVSHDLMLRHVFIISLYIALVPWVSRMGSLSVDGAYRNFGFVVLVVKISCLLHPFLLRRDIGTMLHWWYIMVLDLSRTFEVATAAVTIFYVAIFVYLRRGSLPYDGEHMASPTRELFKSPVSHLFLSFVCTLQYIGIIIHYAVKCERHYFFDRLVTAACLRITGMRNVLPAKKLLGVHTARLYMLFAVLVWVFLAINPGGWLYKSKGSHHHRSTVIFWSIVNMVWVALLLNGPKKALGICLFVFMLYNMVSLMVKIRPRLRATCIILFVYTCDLMYFVMGHQDSLFELDFDSAFLFFEGYSGWWSNISVFFAFAMCNAITSCYLYYMFLLQSEKCYTSLHPPPAASPEMDGYSSSMASVVGSDMFRTVSAYTCMACAQIALTLSLLYLLSNNPCAVTDFYPKGLFNVGKMAVNVLCFWALYCLS
ncbi:putative membrane protein [Babesia divergens]|uniref:Membrane protein n=1 Tax=Babesia divergens TaxID=32595 RepID=A0AAD9LIT7_BABDI|nr:putative membrane protein [Babesia divergens]